MAYRRSQYNFSLVVVLFLFSISFVLSDIITFPPPQCTFSGADTNILAAPESVTNGSCLLKSSKSCCSQAYIDSISADTPSDLITPTALGFFSSASSSCTNFINEALACVPCQEDSFAWTQLLSGQTTTYKITFCNSFCSRFYDACSDSMVSASSQTVAEAYPTKEFFCTSILQGSNIIVNVAAEGEVTCFDSETELCTENDMNFYYTDCIDGRRNLQYDWNFNLTCHGGHNLPASQYNLPCPIFCEAGRYLPLGLTECRSCEAGSFSLGGGIRVEHWTTLDIRNLNFETYCLDRYNEIEPGTPEEPCTGWELNNTYIHSNISGRPSIKSVLQAEVMIKNPNSTISFLAQVDSEYNYDKFTFEIDDDSYWIKNTIDPVISTYPLTVGFHRLKWIYSKDSSIDSGSDSTMIWYIEVTGLSDNNDYCTLCRPGTTSLPESTECFECPINTYNSLPGSPNCIDCPASEYSFPGDDHCTIRRECTSSDWQEFHSPCGENFTRTKHYKWIEPKICVDGVVTLPDDVPNQSCPDCNAGEYRDGDECVFCPPGKYSDVGTEGICLNCPAGSYTPKQLNLNTWDEWPENSSTSCQGECGTAGWRLRSDYLDSGTNHGARSSVTFTLAIMIETIPVGTVEYTFNLSCQGWCYLELHDGLTFVQSTWNDFTEPDAEYSVGPFQLEPGPHNLTWTFSKFFSGRNEDHARLTSVLIEGVPVGGSRECIPCFGGTFSSAPSEKCDQCSPGYFSNNGSISCTVCDANFYQDEPGQSKCKPCPPGTYSSTGATECGNNNCQFSPNNGTTVYDVSYLSTSKPDGMYGPITYIADNPPLSYYLSICEKRSQFDVNRTLIDENGKTLFTHAVAFNPQTNISIDLGNLMGFYPFEGSEDGFSIVFTEGAKCEIEEKDIPRLFNVTMICDPSLGIGQPEPSDQFLVVTNNSCTYNIIWRSLYGCPICTSSDYIAITEACQKNRQQLVKYTWKPNRKCHGGKLPESYNQDCVTSTTCSKGNYLSADDICEPCPMDFYSPGAAEFYERVFFSSANAVSTEPFTTTCSQTPGCTAWSSGNGYMESGKNGNSTVEVIKVFIEGVPTSIEFEYKYIGEGHPFIFYIDSSEELRVNSSEQTYIPTKSFPVSSGAHVFTWVYFHTPSPSNLRDNYVRVRNIRFSGTVNSITECIPCPAGTVTDLDRGYCHECPVNNYVDLTEKGYHQCVTCPENTFRLEGQPFCLEQPTCDDDKDFIKSYPYVDTSPCNTTEEFKPKLPQICKGSIPGVEHHTDCSCPIGKLLNNNVCEACPQGSYYVTGICKNAEQGYMTVPQITHFPTTVKMSTYSPSFTTRVCPVPLSTTPNNQECEFDKGWRLSGNYADSGLYYTEVSSILDFELEVSPTYLGPAKISFTASYVSVPALKNGTVDSSQNGLEFFINGVAQDFPFNIKDTASPTRKDFDLEVGKSYVSWIYSQKAGSPGIVTLSDITVTGSIDGLSVQQMPCPAGSFEDNRTCRQCKPGTYSEAQATKCLPCPENTISGFSAASCEPCGRGTHADRNICRATCKFSVNTTSYSANYDLSSLKQSLVTVIPTSSTGTNYQISLCDKFKSVYCSDDDVCEFSYVFRQFEDGMIRTLGTWLEFEPVDKLNLESDPHTFDISYSRGNNLPPGCTSVNTTIQFICNLQEGKGFPTLIAAETSCEYIFSWSTLYACPVCTEQDSFEVTGPCKDGRRVKYIAYRVPCNGPPQKMIEEECEDLELERSTVLFGVLIGALLIITGIGCACFFFQQKRNIEAKYELLRNEVTEEHEVL